MYIGRVLGTVVATIHQKTYDRHKLLVVGKLDLDGQLTDAYDICVDVVQAGVGDVVLVVAEGNCGRQLLQDPNGAVRAVITGIVDEVEIA